MYVFLCYTIFIYTPESQISQKVNAVEPVKMEMEMEEEESACCWQFFRAKACHLDGNFCEINIKEKRNIDKYKQGHKKKKNKAENK